jgi:hypothetical protein
MIERLGLVHSYLCGSNSGLKTALTEGIKPTKTSLFTKIISERGTINLNYIPVLQEIKSILNGASEKDH